MIDEEQGVFNLLIDRVQIINVENGEIFELNGFLKYVDPNGRYIVNNEGEIYDLQENGKLHIVSNIKPLSIELIHNQEYIALIGDNGVFEIYNLKTKKLIASQTKKFNFYEKISFTKDGRYQVITNNHEETFEVKELFTRKTILSGDGVFKTYDAKDTIFIAVQQPNMTCVYYPSGNNSFKKERYTGIFGQIFPNKLLFTTIEGYASPYLTKIYRLPSIPEEDERVSISEYLFFSEEGFKLPIYTLLGEVGIVSSDNRYIATNYGVYDLEFDKPIRFYSNILPNHQQTSIFFISEDGQYLIEEIANKVLVKNIKTGKSISSSKAEKYISSTWKPYKELAYRKQLGRLYDFIANDTLIRPVFDEDYINELYEKDNTTFKTLNGGLEVQYNFYEFFINNKHTNQQLVWWTVPVGHYIISVTPKDKGQFLEVIYAGTATIDGKPSRNIQTLLLDLGKERLLNK